MPAVNAILLTCAAIAAARSCAATYAAGDERGYPDGAARPVPENQPEKNAGGNGFWDPLNLPKTFDARSKWPGCPSVGKIYDQGNCKSSYAISVASAVSDRICIHSGGREKPTLSAQQILSCCYLCGDGCNGGDHFESWDFYRRHGLVSGGGYGSNEGCQPYTIEPCQHAVDGSAVDNPCSTKIVNQPECDIHCYNADYGTKYANDNHRGTYYKVSGYTAMKEIYEKGPITAAFYMFTDLYNYQSGVYTYKNGTYVGNQAVKLIGWGEENGTPYWLAANSFNTNWGDKGFFKIRRGANECYIEEFMYAGLPL